MPRRQQLKNTFYERRVYGHRVTISILMLLVMTMILIGRYSQLQISDYEIYKTQSDRNRIQLLPIAPKRGLIFDRNGLLLAENIPSYTLTVVKERVKSLDETLAIINEIIPLNDDDIAQFRKRLGRRRPYEAVPLKFRVSDEDIAKLAVNRYRVPGVEIDAQLVRHYPQGELFAHLLGYVGRISERELDVIDPVNYSGTHYIGKIGLEKYYEELLHGTVGYQNVESNAHGRILRVLERHDPLPGGDITLNVDAHVQQVAYDALKGHRGAIVAMDPHTGGVLAMVSAPGYDTNLFVNGISSADYGALQNDPDLPLYNRALQGQYPPASTIKPIWGLAGLHYGVVTPATRIADPGWFSLPDDSRRYRDWKRGGHGSLINLEQAVVQSCDVYFYELAYKLGIDRLHSFGIRFGLGEVTGIDNTNERSGLMPSRAWKEASRGGHWYPGETINVGIGQGFMLATPLQLAVATSVIAARGELYAPRILAAAGEESIDSPLRGRMDDVSEANWDAITHSMEQVVNGAQGTGRGLKAGLSYRMAAKSGTAQVVGIAAGEKYDSEALNARNRDHALFVAFAPADDPKIAVAVVIENGEHGGSVAGPAARKVIDAYLLGDEKPDVVAGSDNHDSFIDAHTGAHVHE
ncbi:Peptidoglycan D,D-transpeptidase MrdA [Zhongshania aliphaticivorans]|uniref:Peptidoglycan D,D-transpeptidase MrdA n=1 Tax=Zhongshania aliphaticivorans TaxID=1470434 RepID=A0A5S9Q6H7_9GAMM|nr:penicillin-binding protein 2 [Zhongshania aliphaticivorans]CAA0094614.1 Peptidoglycan D,D-transpeptidase MrdA [Zhongshania aliphaticivorans]CAA0112588.1 Peptidoglycan D,D-transpeptidase MrdA [Zhongshania aliphaticivorans]